MRAAIVPCPPFLPPLPTNPDPPLYSAGVRRVATYNHAEVASGPRAPACRGHDVYVLWMVVERDDSRRLNERPHGHLLLLRSFVSSIFLVLEEVHSVP